MDWYSLAAAGIFALLGLACLLAVPLGLPGTWLLVGIAVLLELGDTAWRVDPFTFGWPRLAAAAGLAAVGELLEAAAGIYGARRGGASRRGMIGALVGGLVGALVFTPLVPVPVVGTLVGALFGTFLGALWGEVTAEHRRHRNESLRAALYAALGRLAGTFGKLVVGVAVWILLVFAAFRAAA